MTDVERKAVNDDQSVALPDEHVAGPDDEAPVPVRFVGDFDAPIVMADNFSLHSQAGMVILTAGQLRAPTLAGTQEEKRSQFESLDFIPIQVVARLAMSPEVLESLLKAIAEHSSKLDRAKEGADE